MVALAALKAGKWPSIVSLFAVLICELLLHLHSRRINRGAALQVQRHKHPDNGDRTVADDDETLLACVEIETKQQIVIQAKDKPFWDYYYEKGNYFDRILTPLLVSHHPSTHKEVVLSLAHDEKPRSLNCKTYTEPPKPAATLNNLTSLALPDDVINLIASADDSALHCKQCEEVYFNMNFLEKCSKPRTLLQFLTVHEEVQREGGTCRLTPKSPLEKGRIGTPSKPAEHTLQTCMGENDYRTFQQEKRVFAVCESLQWNPDLVEIPGRKGAYARE